MRKIHQNNTVRYYLLVLVFLAFLFFSGDLGLIDVQKTAIVMAVGIDREEDTFIITSQIAVPQSSKQGQASETVQLVSRGKTVADAFEEINAKTGWYPKLVFCRLILLGEKTAERDVFDALDFFLLDEYMSDNCLLATCDGFAKDMLNVTALIDPSGSVAMQKVLSSHAERVGTVSPTTLREFAIGYFSESKSWFLPVLKTQPQQEQIGTGTGDAAPSPESSQSSFSQSDASSSSSEQTSEQSSSQTSGESADTTAKNASESKNEDKPVFSAGETALFVEGKRVGKFSENETFAFNAFKRQLRLAVYSVKNGDATCTLTVKRNTPKKKFRLGNDGRVTLQIELTMSAGLLDYSKALSVEGGKDMGDVPDGVFSAAEKLLASQIQQAFEKCRACDCDLFGVTEYLQKHQPKRFPAIKAVALENAILDVSVRFRNVR